MKLLIKSGSRCFPQKTRYHPTACNQNVLCPTSRPGCSSMLPRATSPETAQRLERESRKHVQVLAAPLFTLLLSFFLAQSSALHLGALATVLPDAVSRPQMLPPAAIWNTSGTNHCRGNLLLVLQSLCLSRPGIAPSFFWPASTKCQRQQPRGKS